MGGSSSKTSMDVYTKNVVEALSKSIQNCEGNTIINQRITIKGNYNVVKNVRLVQGMKLSTKCAADITNVSSTQQAVTNAIKQQSDAQNVALLGAVSSSSSKNTTAIHNEVMAAITQETIQNIINSFNATQEFYLDGNSNIVEDITMEQSMEVLQDNCLKALSSISSVQELKNNADSISKATQTNPVSEIIGSIGSILTSLGSMWTIILIVGLIVGAYVIVNGGGLSAIFGDNSTSGQQPNAMPMQSMPMRPMPMRPMQSMPMRPMQSMPMRPMQSMPMRPMQSMPMQSMYSSQ
jgi:hypothetical protein